MTEWFQRKEHGLVCDGRVIYFVATRGLVVFIMLFEVRSLSHYLKIILLVVFMYILLKFRLTKHAALRKRRVFFLSLLDVGYYIKRKMPFLLCLCSIDND